MSVRKKIIVRTRYGRSGDGLVKDKMAKARANRQALPPSLGEERQ